MSVARFYSTNAGTTPDYIRYLASNPVKNDRINDATLLDFSLSPTDSSFVPLRAGNYIVFTSKTYPVWFTGYITNDPDYQYLGKSSSGLPVWGYKYKASDDSIILSVSPLGVRGPYINMTQGQIISALADEICPGLFDCSNVQSGAIYPRYIPDPTRTFNDVVSDFCKAANYRFMALNHQLFFVPVTTGAALTVDGSDKRMFTPANLSVSTSPNPIINEAVVVGQVEPQNHVSEYFVGDGSTGDLPLASSVFGGVSSVLLDDDFSSASIDTSKWTIYDPASEWLNVSNGFLNSLGGNGTNALDVHLDAYAMLQLQNALRLTHGDWDFIDNQTTSILQGIIGSLWTGAPSMTDINTYPGCVHGLRIARTPNIISDSDISGDWPHEDSLLAKVLGGGAVCGNAIQYTGTGSASGTHYWYTRTISVTPGQRYAISGYIDARNVISGMPSWAVHSPDLATYYGGAFQNPGVTGRVSSSFVVPAGVTQVVVVCDLNNCTVTNGASLRLSNPQLESGSTATPYMQGVQCAVSPNLVPDSGNLNATNGYLNQTQYGTWSASTEIAVLVTGLALGCTWEYIGQGIPSGAYNVASQSFAVTPGQTYTLSGFIDGTNVTAGNPEWVISDVNVGIGYASAQQQPGRLGYVQATFTVPAGVTQVKCAALTNNCTVLSGATLLWSCPQLELGSVASPYQPTGPTNAAQRAILAHDVEHGAVILSKWFQINTSTRNVLRTILDVSQQVPPSRTFTGLNAQGQLVTYGCAASPTPISLNPTVYVSEIDPLTGALDVGFPLTFASSLQLPANELNLVYTLMACNDLHAAVTGVTLSSPIPATLEIMPKGATSFTTKLLGPNDVDGLDGLTSYATVNQSGGSSSNTNPTLGNPPYDEGSPKLVFFKDSNRLTSTVPQVGDIVHFKYRRAGNAAGAVRDTNSVAALAASWGDSGVRTVFHNDLSPLPATSAECELAAAAIVGENSFTHYNGSYTVYSDYVTAEPLAGMILPFTNLPAGTFGVSSFAEIIYQVNTTFDYRGNDSTEHFIHAIQFGNSNGDELLREQLSQFQSQQDILINPDTVSAPPYVTYAGVGKTTAPDIDALTLDFTRGNGYGVDDDFIYATTNCSVPVYNGFTGFFEVRYTDDSWGSDNGKNLVTRSLGPQFAIPRTPRGKMVFVKAVDARNQCLYSEDLSVGVWAQDTGFAGSGSVHQSVEVGPDENRSLISVVTSGAGSANNALYQEEYVNAIGGKQLAFSFSIKGPAGKQVVIWLTDGTWNTVIASPTITCTGQWQRITVSGTCPAGTAQNVVTAFDFGASPSQTFQITRCSLEIGTLTETLYAKTRNVPYGAMSRFAAVLKVNYPLLPPPPTANIDLTDIANPVINLVDPVVMMDVWGYEVRRSDQHTVLYHDDLTDSSYSPQVVDANNTLRSLSYWLYSYNLLGEFSTSPSSVMATIPTPTITSAAVTEGNATAVFPATDTAKITFQIFSDAQYQHQVLSVTQTAQSYALSATDFFSQRYFKVTPSDAIGSGTAVLFSHVYAPAAVDQFNNQEIVYVAAPPTPTTDPTPPSGLGQYSQDYINESWRNYIRNRRLYTS